MLHFKDYKEYHDIRDRFTGREEEKKTELVMEDNTIYEIDVKCEECLKAFFRLKAEKER